LIRDKNLLNGKFKMFFNFFWCDESFQLPGLASRYRKLKDYLTFKIFVIVATNEVQTITETPATRGLNPNSLILSANRVKTWAIVPARINQRAVVNFFLNTAFILLLYFINHYLYYFTPAVFLGSYWAIFEALCSIILFFNIYFLEKITDYI